MNLRGRRLGILIGCGLTVVAIGVAYRLRDARPARTLEIEQRTSAGTMAQLFWDAGAGFDEANSSRLALQRTPEGFQRLRFVLPRTTLRGLRLDPTDASGDLLIRRIRVLDSNEHTVAVLNPASLLPMQQVASMTRGSDGVRIATSGDDPFLFMTAACLDGPASPYSLYAVTPLSLVLASMAVASLLAACLVTIGRELLGRGGGADGVSVQQRHLAVLWLAALFLVSFSAKLLLIRHYPAPVPYEDQWWGEAGLLYVPFGDGCLSWRQMLTLHNEHRVFFTRLLALALLSVNGQWDPQLQQFVNAALHAITAVIVAAIFWLALGRRWLDVIVLTCGVAFALPFSWENTLTGFQSAFYFLLLFTALALWLTGRYRAGSGPWFLGWLCAFSALFTSAGGLLTPVALAVTPAVRFLNNRRHWREVALNLGAAGLVVAVGVATAAPPLPQHAMYKAGTPGAFATALARNLAWPRVDSPIVGVLMWLPVAAIVLIALRRRKPATQSEQLIFGLGTWVVLQAAALAYARGVGGQPPASRYMDMLSLGFVANTMALLAAFDHTRAKSIGRRIAVMSMAGWLVIAIIGVERLTNEALRTGALARLAWMQAYEQNVRQFLQTDDAAALTSKPYPFQVPFWNPPMLVNAWLRHPYVRQILPPAIREPLQTTPRSDADGTFVTDGVYPVTPTSRLRPSRGSYTNRGNPTEGRFESQPIPGCRVASHLKFEVAGYLRQPGLSLAVKDVRSGREQKILPRELARERWIDARVSCPDGPFTIVAVDATPDFWFAFRDPVEIGWASDLAEWLIVRSRALLLVALAVAVLAIRWT